MIYVGTPQLQRDTINYLQQENETLKKMLEVQERLEETLNQKLRHLQRKERKERKEIEALKSNEELEIRHNSIPNGVNDNELFRRVSKCLLNTIQDRRASKSPARSRSKSPTAHTISSSLKNRSHVSSKSPLRTRQLINDFQLEQKRKEDPIEKIKNILQEISSNDGRWHVSSQSHSEPSRGRKLESTGRRTSISSYGPNPQSHVALKSGKSSIKKKSKSAIELKYEVMKILLDPNK